ncbi:hypothetical protein BaRGS_00021881 [Batillaria attramentaria]|uniref:Uncharacterized protein n=1 Tax=Batillaria attramentaria TaxID=370345 RepID=A0ABD0KJ40_9CAEN
MYSPSSLGYSPPASPEHFNSSTSLDSFLESEESRDTHVTDVVSSDRDPGCQFPSGDGHADFTTLSPAVSVDSYGTGSIENLAVSELAPQGKTPPVEDSMEWNICGKDPAFPAGRQNSSPWQPPETFMPSPLASPGSVMSPTVDRSPEPYQSPGLYQSPGPYAPSSPLSPSASHSPVSDMLSPRTSPGYSSPSAYHSPSSYWSPGLYSSPGPYVPSPRYSPGYSPRSPTDEELQVGEEDWLTATSLRLPDGRLPDGRLPDE